MQLNAKMGFGPKSLEPESDEVIAALEAYNELATQISMGFSNPDPEFRKRLSLAQERDRKHEEVDTWHAAEYKKLPLVDYSEAGSYPDQKAEYALRVTTLAKHIAVENEYLQALFTFWPVYRDHLKNQYTPFQQKLAAIHYGEDAINIENKRILIGGQGSLLTPAETLNELSRETTDTAAKWWLNKLELEKQKPL